MAETAYQESETHIPHPTHQTGTLDTSGTAGTADSDLKTVTPIFDLAEKHDLETAARALDPDDHEVPEHLVVLPTGAVVQHSDPEAAKQRVVTKARSHKKRTSAKSSSSAASSSPSAGSGSPAT